MSRVVHPLPTVRAEDAPIIDAPDQDQSGNHRHEGGEMSRHRHVPWPLPLLSRPERALTTGMCSWVLICLAGLVGAVLLCPNLENGRLIAAIAFIAVLFVASLTALASESLSSILGIGSHLVRVALWITGAVCVFAVAFSIASPVSAASSWIMVVVLVGASGVNLAFRPLVDPAAHYGSEAIFGADATTCLRCHAFEAFALVVLIVASSLLFGSGSVCASDVASALCGGVLSLCSMWAAGLVRSITDRAAVRESFAKGSGGLGGVSGGGGFVGPRLWRSTTSSGLAAGASAGSLSAAGSMRSAGASVATGGLSNYVPASTLDRSSRGGGDVLISVRQQRYASGASSDGTFLVRAVSMVDPAGLTDCTVRAMDAEVRRVDSGGKLRKRSSREDEKLPAVLGAGAVEYTSPQHFSLALERGLAAARAAAAAWRRIAVPDAPLEAVDLPKSLSERLASFFKPSGTQTTTEEDPFESVRSVAMAASEAMTALVTRLTALQMAAKSDLTELNAADDISPDHDRTRGGRRALRKSGSRHVMPQHLTVRQRLSYQRAKMMARAGGAGSFRNVSARLFSDMGSQRSLAINPNSNSSFRGLASTPSFVIAAARSKAQTPDAHRGQFGAGLTFGDDGYFGTLDEEDAADLESVSTAARRHNTSNSNTNSKRAAPLLAQLRQSRDVIQASRRSLEMNKLMILNHNRTHGGETPAAETTTNEEDTIASRRMLLEEETLEHVMQTLAPQEHESERLERRRRQQQHMRSAHGSIQVEDDEDETVAKSNSRSKRLKFRPGGSRPTPAGVDILSRIAARGETSGTGSEGAALAREIQNRVMAASASASNSHSHSASKSMAEVDEEHDSESTSDKDDTTYHKKISGEDSKMGQKGKVELLVGSDSNLDTPSSPTKHHHHKKDLTESPISSPTSKSASIDVAKKASLADSPIPEDSAFNEVDDPSEANLHVVGRDVVVGREEEEEGEEKPPMRKSMSSSSAGDSEAKERLRAALSRGIGARKGSKQSFAEVVLQLVSARRSIVSMMRAHRTRHGRDTGDLPGPRKNAWKSPTMVANKDSGDGIPAFSAKKDSTGESRIVVDGVGGDDEEEEDGVGPSRAMVASVPSSAAPPTEDFAEVLGHICSPGFDVFDLTTIASDRAIPPAVGIELGLAREDGASLQLGRMNDLVDEEEAHRAVGSGTDMTTSSRPIGCVVRHILDSEGLWEPLQLPKKATFRFLAMLESSYCAVPYHNKFHVADVTASLFRILKTSGVWSLMDSLDQFSVIFAASVHDLEHPGVNNNYLIQTSDDVAVLYNDRSVLENHHVAASFQLLYALASAGLTEGAMLENFAADDFRAFRRVVVDCVLATDMARHMAVLKDFREMVDANVAVNNERYFEWRDAVRQTRAQREPNRPSRELDSNDGDTRLMDSPAAPRARAGFMDPGEGTQLVEVSDAESDDEDGLEPSEALAVGLRQGLRSREDWIVMYSIALKSADIGHTAKPQKLHRRWTRRVLTEMWRQGDREKMEDFDISPMCDRTRFSDTGAVATSQVGFLQFVCLPLFRAWDGLAFASLRLSFYEHFHPTPAAPTMLMSTGIDPTTTTGSGAELDEFFEGMHTSTQVEEFPDPVKDEYLRRESASTLAHQAEVNRTDWAEMAEEMIRKSATETAATKPDGTETPMDEDDTTPNSP